MDVAVEPLANDHAVALPPVHFDRIFGVHGTQVIESGNQYSLTALRLQELRQQGVRAHRLSAGIERRKFQRWQRLVPTFGDALHAIADGGPGVGEIADQYRENRLAAPG